MPPLAPAARGLAAAALSALAAAVAGCGPSGGPPPGPPQMPPPVVTVIHPVPYTVQSYHEYNGYLNTVDRQEVRARVKGYLEKVHFVEGTEVKAGADLYTIDPREYTAGVAKAEADIAKGRADEANANAQISRAQADVTRLTKAGSAASETETDAARATLAAQQATLKTALASIQAAEASLITARLQVEYSHVKAPIDGQISRTLVTQGNLVGQTESTLLTTINRMDQLFIEFDAAERDLLERLRAPKDTATTADQRPNVAVELGVANEPGYPHRGTIDFRENRVDQNSGTIHVRGRVDNPFGPDGKTRLLYPGLYAKIRVPSGGPRTLPVIPEVAVLTGQEGSYLYVLGPDNTVQKRTVTLVAQPVWKAPPPVGPPVPGWTLGLPTSSPPPPAAPAGAPSASAGGAPGGNAPGAPPPPPRPLPVLSVVAVEKGLTLDDVVLVNGLVKVRPGAPAAPETRPLLPPQAAPEKAPPPEKK